MIRKWFKVNGLSGLALLVVLGLGLAVRLLAITAPLIDFHPVRQLRSASIARGLYFAQDARTDPTLRAQAVGVMPVDVHEPPINEQVVAWLYMLAGGEQVWLPRLLSVIYWMIGGLALFAIGRRYASFWPALMGLLFYLVLPFSVQASRAFMPDPGMIMWIVLTAWAALRWTEKPSWKNAILMGALAGMGILWKVVAGFFIAPVLILVVISKIGWRGALRSIPVWAAALLALAPAVVYYLVLHGGRAGEYFTYNTLEMLKMLLTSKFYAQWLAMANGLVSLSMVLFAWIGMALAGKTFRMVLLGLWLGYAAYGLTWPFQYTTHEYYHLSLLPIIGLSLMPLAQTIVGKLNEQGWFWRVLAVLAVLVGAGYQFWIGRSMLVGSEASTEPRSWQLVGQAIPPNGSFIALTNDYGVRLEYFGMRKAGYYWPGSTDLAVAQLRGQSAADVMKTFKENTRGYTYFLVTALGELEKQPELKRILAEYYPIYHQGSGFMVYDLSKPLKALP